MQRIWNLLKWVLAAVLFLAAVRCYASAQKTADISTAVLQPQSLTGKQAAEICEQEAEQEAPLSICFWGEQEEAVLRCRETGDSSIVTVVLTVGNAELLAPGTGALAYQENGCFLDRETAVELFGTEYAAGQILWYGDASYIVYGTFESLQKKMICRADDNGQTDTVLDMIYLRESPTDSDTESANNAQYKFDSDWGSDSDAARQFLLRHDLNGEIVESVFLNALAGNLLLILPLIFCAGLVQYLVGQIKSAESRCKKAGYLAIAAAVLAVSAFFFHQNVQIPSGMIPSRWSDFSFWNTWWEEERSNLLLLLQTIRGETRLDMVWNLLLSFFCNFGAVLAGMSAIVSVHLE